MVFEGLSTDQAPPISAPLRFFLTAPLFAFLAGAIMFFGDASVLASRYAPQSVALTHAVTIGFFAFVMFGALTQMLPVLAGVKIAKVGSVSLTSYVLLLAGTLLMVFGLLFGVSWMSFAASAFLGGGFIISALFMLGAIRRVVNFTASIKAMTVALFFALFASLLGAHLLASYGRGVFSDMHAVFANIHSVWAVFGFAGILIIGVAFHILPMFYVAPRFKNFCKRRVIWLISAGLLLWMALNIWAPSYAYVAKIWVALFFWAFATTVYMKLNERRRKVTDVTIWYWRSASVFMTLGMFAWVANDFLDEKYTAVVSVLIGGGFFFSVISGMLYKIVPFLVWFHLNARGYMSIPTMNDMIDKKLAKLQFALFVFSLSGLVVSFFVLSILPLFALTFMASMLILEYNIVAPVLIYTRTIKTKPDFDMSMFTMKAENNQ